MLTLPIKKRWFDMICSGEKTDEYREITPYWAKRFGWQEDYEYSDNHPPDRVHKLVMVSTNLTVIFKNGYGKDSPQIKCLVHITKGQGKAAWGAIPGKEYFVLHIEKILERN